MNFLLVGFFLVTEQQAGAGIGKGQGEAFSQVAAAHLEDFAGRQTNPDPATSILASLRLSNAAVGVGLPAGEVFEMRGRNLAEGLTLILSNPRSSLLLRYEKRSD